MITMVFQFYEDYCKNTTLQCQIEVMGERKVKYTKSIPLGTLINAGLVDIAMQDFRLEVHKMLCTITKDQSQCK